MLSVRAAPGAAGRRRLSSLIAPCRARKYYFERRIDLVAGIVKTPAIDLVNADLLSAHVHAEWLAAARESLGKSIPENLDMDAEGLPVKPTILGAFATAMVDTEVEAHAGRIVVSALPTDGAPQIGDPVQFVAGLWRAGTKEFDAAFRRWRELYRFACQDREEAHAIGQRTDLSAQERREARARCVMWGR